MHWYSRLTLGTAAAVAIAAATAGCKPTAPKAQAAEAGAATVALRPFTGDPKVAREGRALFLEFNCYGCHGGLAGGGMGPSLRDTTWKYGGTDAAIHSSIHDGRFLGMPTWGSTLTPEQIDTLVVYITSLRTSAEPKFFWAVDTGTASGATP